MRFFDQATRLLFHVWVGMRTALVEMGGHKLRSALSIVGVMLGVAALVAMLSLVGGIQTFLQQKMGRWVGSMVIEKERDAPTQERLSWSRSPGLHLSDGDELGEISPEVKEVCQRIDRRGTITIGGVRLDWIGIRGESPEAYAADTTLITLDKGRLLTPEDYQSGGRVCLVSWGICDQLADRWASSGRSIDSLPSMWLNYGRNRFLIVGTIKPRDPDYRPWQFNRTVIMPLLTMRKYVTGFDPDPGRLTLTISQPEAFADQAERISAVLIGLHRGARDFQYHGAEWADNMRRTFGNIALVMGIISVVSLLVGGLGIMNVMLSSISERIREIGVRKALGARNSQILIQFIAETITLSFVGGLIGMALGLVPIFFSDAIKKSTQGVIAPTVLPQHVILVVAVIAAVGVLFGLYPAIRAARMDPVEALRCE